MSPRIEPPCVSEYRDILSTVFVAGLKRSAYNKKTESGPRSENWCSETILATWLLTSLPDGTRRLHFVYPKEILSADPADVLGSEAAIHQDIDDGVVQPDRFIGQSIIGAFADTGPDGPAGARPPGGGPPHDASQPARFRANSSGLSDKSVQTLTKTTGVSNELRPLLAMSLGRIICAMPRLLSR